MGQVMEYVDFQKDIFESLHTFFFWLPVLINILFEEMMPFELLFYKCAHRTLV